MAENKEIENASVKEVKTGGKKATPSKLKKPFKALKKLFKESKSEMGKVTWAGKLATTKNTVLVIVVLLVVGVIFGLFDVGFRWLVDFIMDLY